MKPSAHCMTNYWGRHSNLRIADDLTRTIEGYGDISLVFRLANGLVQVVLTNVSPVPDLRRNRLSLRTLLENGHISNGCRTGGCSQAHVGAFDRVSVDAEPVQPFRLQGRLQHYGKCMCCSRTRKPSATSPWMT